MRKPYPKDLPLGNDMHEIKQIIWHKLGRIHVMTPYLHVCRQIIEQAGGWAACKERLPTWQHRRHLFRTILWGHKRNRSLYLQVMCCRW